MDKINKHLKIVMNAMRNNIIQLKAENFQLKKVIEHLPGDVYWKDKDGKWLGVNSTGSTTLKKMGFIAEKKDILGKTDFQLFNKETAEQFRKHDIEVMTQKIEIIKEEINVLPSGEEIIQLSTKRPLYNEQGEIVGIVGNTIDITYLKHIEADLKIAKEKAEAASHAKSEFIANISHDLRTPLTGLITMSETLRDKLAGQEGEEEAMLLHESGLQILDFCNNILDFISADNDTGQTIQERCFNLQELIQSISALEMPMIKSKSLTFSSYIDSDIPLYLIKDNTKLFRVLLNLLGNAIKFTEKGHVGIHAKMIEQDSDNVTVEFSVTDTGIGIKPELQQQIFEHFFRINASYKGVYNGNGLGLAIAQKYVQLLGADRIYVDSKENKGSRFHFKLSFKIGKQQTQKIQPTNKHTSINDLKLSSSVEDSRLSNDVPFLLLIEDNKIALFSLEILVKKAGCRFKSAETGEKGVELAKKYNFDLIISDIGLPGISGIEVAIMIRAWEKENHRNKVPIVALTGHAAQMAESECLQAGIDKVLTKAASSANLTNILEQFILKNKEITSNKIPESNNTEHQVSSVSNTGLGLDLPDTEEALFALNQYPYIDTAILKNIYGENYFDIAGSALKLMSIQLIKDKEDISRAFIANDWDKVEKLAHRAKGGAAACGLLRMKYACQYLERYRKAGLSNLLDKLYYQLIDILDETKVYLTDWLQKF